MTQVYVYFVATNAYNEVILDDGESRYILSNSEVPQGSDVSYERINDFLCGIEDYSSWDEYSETVQELIGDSAILACAGRIL